MRATIDAVRRVVIPKAIREGAGLRASGLLDVKLVDGRIEIEPAALPVQLLREGRFLVAVPSGDGAPLTAEEVEQNRQGISAERAGELFGG